MAISIVRVHNAAFGTSATPAAQNFDLSSARAVLILFCAWTGAALTLNSCTVAGASTSITGIARNGDENAVYAAFLANCSTSATAAIQPVWSAALTDGPTIHVVVLTCAGGQDVSVIDSDFDSAIGSGSTSVTSTSTTGDFVVGQAEEFGATPDLGGSQTAVGGTTYTNNSQQALVYTITAGAATTTSTGNGNGTDAYPSISQVVLREVAGAAAVSDIPGRGSSARNLRTNAAYRMRNRIYVPERYAG